MAHASDDYPFELGAYHQKVATESATAQLWFNRGCVWGANFHHEEAAHCFEQAAKADPKCAMAHWGIAYVHGPNYNFHAKNGFYGLASQEAGYPSLNVAVAAVAKAAALCEGGPPREKALIDALAARYEWPVTDSTPALQDGYAERMARVADAFADDADVQVLI